MPFSFLVLNQVTCIMLYEFHREPTKTTIFDLIFNQRKFFHTVYRLNNIIIFDPKIIVALAFYNFFSFFSLVNFVFHVTLNSPLSTVVCANTLLETMTTHITATNVAFAGNKKINANSINSSVKWDKMTEIMQITIHYGDHF